MLHNRLQPQKTLEPPYEVGIDLLYLWIHRNKVTTPMQSTAVVNLKSIAPSWTSDIPSCKASCTTSYALQSSCITSCTPSCTASCTALCTTSAHILHTILKKSHLVQLLIIVKTPKVKREAHTRNEKKFATNAKVKQGTRNTKRETRNTNATKWDEKRITIQLPSQPLHCDMRSSTTPLWYEILKYAQRETNNKCQSETRNAKRETRNAKRSRETANEKRKRATETLTQQMPSETRNA